MMGALSCRRAMAGACLAFLLATTGSFAQTPGAAELGLYDIADKLPGHSTVSYFDLLKQVVPDLSAGKDAATGRRIGTLRHIAGPDSGAGAPDVIRISSLQALTFQAQGKPAIAILAEIGEVEASVEQPVVLAVFEDGESPRLLDFVDVGMDRLTGFGSPKLLRIGPNDQAIVTDSQHFNSNENFGAQALIFMRDGKLQLIDTFSTFGVSLCSRRETQTLSFRAQAAGGTAPYFAIAVSLKEQRVRTGETCAGEKRLAPYARTVTTTYGWNPAKGRFVAKSDAIKRLEKATGERLN
ncbi:hypothetical protein PY365_28035 [Roseiarcaceae bacterium H3SJ34-1]|uniref:hypothetical protein n=1 Tax=Terripilifer ovatus TaxID=3032367 RepID=UPI003AB9AC0A|nr:hypothetical protein [Roseiarcaceae bacterium H3SJ34-1]